MEQAQTTPVAAQTPAPPAPGMGLREVVFLVAAVGVLIPWKYASPQFALGVGIILALLGLTAFGGAAKKASRLLIQVCVVLLGFRIDLHTLFHAAGEGLLFAAATIIGTMALGLLLGRLLNTGRELSLLISSGTAVCGGSAIAAVGSAIAATSTQMAVATGAVFLLNAAALYLFPLIGHGLHLSNVQFGTWAGVAIHDISSVVGAASGYHADQGPETPSALDVANVVKLSRVLWIFPIALFAGWVVQRGTDTEGKARSKMPPVPWFILLFLAASAVRSWVPGMDSLELSDAVKFWAGLGFQLALFLIGAGLSRKAIASVGWRALVQAVVLWAFIAGSSLAVVRIAL